MNEDWRNGETQRSPRFNTMTSILNVQGKRSSHGCKAKGEAGAILGLVFDLCQSLEAANVAYCHWKSNEALARSASGDNDLDLLVSRRDVQRFREILARLGFKEAIQPPLRALPGVVSYYGLDRESGRLVHVHAHYVLILGDDMTKNYRLPIEEAYVACATQGQLFRVPTREFEFVVFVIRMVLKHSSWDAILSRRGTLSRNERRELEFLTRGLDQEAVRAILSAHLPLIDERLLNRCARSLQAPCSVWFRVGTALELQRRLAGHGRRRPVTDAALKLWRRGAVVANRYLLRRRTPKARLSGGGAFISVVSGDGAARSWAVDELHVWLSKHFSTMKMHSSEQPPRSFTSIALLPWLHLGQAHGLIAPPQGPVASTSHRGLTRLRWKALLLGEALVARDRHLSYVRARKFVSAGGLVICDTSPRPASQEGGGDRTAGESHPTTMDSLGRYLIRLGKRYESRVHPEQPTAVRAVPEVVIDGKSAEDRALVLSEETWDSSKRMAGIGMHASRPEADIVAAIKSVVWSRL
jgi:hypothetical protein